MSMFKLVQPGTWWIKSKTDERWNSHGSCNVGGFMMPTPAREKIDTLEELYGEPPEDLEWGYMKN